MEQRSSSTSESLDELAQKYGTDKSSLGHGYTKQYVKYLEHLRDEPLTVLELGWGGHEDPDSGGASAQMWRDYFKNGTIVCIDLEEKVITDAHSEIDFRQGSQSDPEFIQSLANEFGQFDLIVDDASHLSSLTIKSWELLYPHLRSGGLYVVEDTHMSYHDFYYGDTEANPDPAKAASGNQTAMQYFKRMADEVNFRGETENDFDLFPRKYWMGYSLEFVHFYFDILFVEKR